MSELRQIAHTIAGTYFDGDARAASRLGACLEVIADMTENRRVPPDDLNRRDKLSDAAKRARQLARKCRTFDARTVVLAMRGDQPGQQPLDTLIAYDAFLGQLDNLATGLDRLARAESPRRPGRPPREDALVFGLECLRAIWRKHREDTPSQSTRHGGFGALAETVFMAKPFSFGENTIRHAVAQLLSSKRPTKDE